MICVSCKEAITDRAMKAKDEVMGSPTYFLNPDSCNYLSSTTSTTLFVVSAKQIWKVFLFTQRVTVSTATRTTKKSSFLSVQNAGTTSPRIVFEPWIKLGTPSISSASVASPSLMLRWVIVKRKDAPTVIIATQTQFCPSVEAVGTQLLIGLWGRSTNSGTLSALYVRNVRQHSRDPKISILWTISPCVALVPASWMNSCWGRGGWERRVILIRKLNAWEGQRKHGRVEMLELFCCLVLLF